MDKFIRQHSGKLLCVKCAREFTPRAARFHTLRCKSHATTGAVVNGVRAAAPDQLKMVR